MGAAVGTETARAGRPRDTARERAILAAAQQLIAEVGYDRMSIEAVAARAGAGKATVYRRWATKSDLAIAALIALNWNEPAPDTGELRSDLLHIGRAYLGRHDERDAVFAGVVAALPREPRLRAALDEIVAAPRRQAFTVAVANARRRGEIVADGEFDLVARTFPALIFHRLSVRDGPVDDAYLTRIVDEIALPLLIGQSQNNR
ncbi:TetR/AcrR family transcriptional regulator [Tsukamurella sp. 8F]|uniref:TetR/AcrR family transcriptional regulator n=1 Tax=unclassified Tsukamurella TaxID=2633480 RepID=UPI0023B97B52|nr:MULTISPECIES: TetR/AcrR family transcriptional regulator [unclassified Tsukamurella]MDF0530793.1 TetR/AcrR family transcriptional regulator [Tsukamurella sp. 8J]MDF0588319.1 TetR/AcrR family transcriptional regulator [Tsukamurella sp. 8F]